jgi:hypothetical protein
VAAYRSFQKKTQKRGSQPILIKNLPWTHVELKFGVLGVARNVVKYVVHSLKN